jgi:hypothetical protein
MSQQINEPLRGEAALAAARLRVANANEAASPRGCVDRAADTADAAERRREAERQARLNLPKQAGRR